MTKPSFKAGSPGKHCQHIYGAGLMHTILALWPGVLVALLPGPCGLTQITLFMAGYSCWKPWTRFTKQINAPSRRIMYTLPFTAVFLQHLSPTVVVNHITWRRQSDHKICKYSYPVWLTEEKNCSCSCLLYTFFQMLRKNGNYILLSHFKKINNNIACQASRVDQPAFQSQENSKISLFKGQRAHLAVCAAQLLVR